MGEVVNYQVRDGVAVLTIDRPPVNAVNVDVRRGVIEGVAKAGADSSVQAIALTCAGRTFLSGADLTELESGVIEEPNWFKMLDALEGSDKPVVAALFGTALGGGFETAMACHYRIIAASGRVGMPEISLGILPGAQGTQRLPRLIGAKPALALMMKGAPVGAQEAKDLGLVDEIAEGDLTEAAVAAAKKLAGQPLRRTSELSVDTTGFDDAGIDEILKANARALKNRTTQHELIKLVQTAANTSFAEGAPIEREASNASLTSAEGKALIHVFFAETRAARIPGVAPGSKGKPISKAAVVGAGTMGGGIAMALADNGVPVTLIEAKQENLDRGLGVMRGNYEATVKRGRLTPEALEQRMGLITGALDMSAAADADVVIEAVFEDMDLKKSILKQLDAVTRPDCILASNTSSLSINELASVTGRPDKVVGLHFFSPANVMRLLEIVRGDQTSSETLVTALEIAKKLRKVGVVAGDGFGFIGNRMMLDGEFREAELMLLQGVAPERIDKVAEDFGFAMGPNRVNDMAGVDVGTKVRIELFKREKRAAPYHVVSDALTPMGRLGQKTGKGVYKYEPGDRNAHHDDEVDVLIAQLAAQYGIEKREVSDKEIEERLVLSLINVGADILDEGLAYRASDIDVVWTSGYGFPRYRGGPMHYADSLGLKAVLERIEHYQQELGDYWKPARLLKDLAEKGASFAAWDAERK